MATHTDLGSEGEQLAVRHLERKGYTILERNYRFQKAEIDIIAQQGNTVAIVEVKTRSSTDFGNPEDFVKPKKIKLLVKAADEYVITSDLDVDIRFDIIAILHKDNNLIVRHLEDAFYHF